MQIALRGTLLAAILALVALLAFAVRILPLQWGAFLSEFDPYWHNYVAQRVVDQGFLSVYGWTDTRTWFPFGRIVDTTTPMGLPYTVAVFHMFVNGIGFRVPVTEISIYTPPVMAAVTSVAIYFLGKDVGGKGVGLLAALFLALNSAFISRTTLGFLKHETVGILAIILIVFFFLRAIDTNRPFRSSILYGVLAGLAVTYLNISWGAFLFMSLVMPLLAVVLILLGKYSTRLFLAYSLAMGLSLLLSAPFPRFGFSFLSSLPALAIMWGFVVLLIAEASRSARRVDWRILFVVVLVIVTAAGIIVASQSDLSSLPGKTIGVLDPTQRTGPSGTIVGSVAEHRLATWSAFYIEFGNLLLFAPLGLLFAMKRRRNEDIFLVLAGLVSLYFASSFIRLTLVMAPFFAVLAAYGFIMVARPFYGALSKGTPIARTKFSPKILPQLGIIFIIVLASLFVPTFIRSVDGANTPATIASASAPIREFRADWFEAFSWMQSNVPANEPILAWWDYGYWIAFVGNRTSIADNATLDTKQIASIGKILLSEESTAISLASEQFGAKYILIFVTTSPGPQGHGPWGFGDEGKWVFMADIANGFFPEISRSTVDKDGNGLPDTETLMGKAIEFAVGRNVDFTSSEVAFVSSSHELLGTDRPSTQVIIIKAKET